jgi:tetratricopeptide (TPR) repeat protein
MPTSGVLFGSVSYLPAVTRPVLACKAHVFFRVFMHGLILHDAIEYNKAACCFLRVADLLQRALASGLSLASCACCSASSRGRPNFVNRPYLLYKAARCHTALGEHDKAFELLGLVPFRERTLAIHFDFGKESQRRGKRDAAIASFREVLRANPFSVQLIAPMVRLGCSILELESMIRSRTDIPAPMQQWMLAHVRSEAAAKASRFDEAVQCLMPFLSTPQGVETAPTSSKEAPAFVMDSSTAIFARHSRQGEHSQASLLPNRGVSLQVQLHATAPFFGDNLPFVCRPSMSKERPLFASGHPFVAERIMVFLAEGQRASSCLALSATMRVVDPFGADGTESIAYALTCDALAPSAHCEGGSRLQLLSQELRALMSTWQSDRQKSTSWVIAGLLCLLQGDSHNAIRFVNTALQCDAYDELAMTVKGHILLAMGSFHAAANHFFTSDTRKPSFACSQGVVQCYTRLGRWPLALSHADNAVKAHSNDHRAHTMYGKAVMGALAAGVDESSSDLQRFALTFEAAQTAVSICISCTAPSRHAVHTFTV